MNDNFEIVCDSSDRSSWLDARANGVGASEVAAMLGESRWESALSLYVSKTTPRRDDEQTEAQFWGLRLEKVVAEVYAERTGRPTEWSGLMLRSKLYPWMVCTLDARTGSERADWPCDAKTAHALKASEWSDGPPRDYYLQLQQQMLVTGEQKATIACLLGGQRLVWCDVERDEIECRRIVHMTRIFWERCVLARVPPAPDGSAASREALAAMYPDANDATVVLDSEFDELFDELGALKATAKTMKRRTDEIENRFKAALGTASCGVLPSRNTVHWEERAGGILYKAAAESLGATPQMLERFRNGRTRTFTIKNAKEL